MSQKDEEQKSSVNRTSLSSFIQIPVTPQKNDDINTSSSSQWNEPNTNITASVIHEVDEIITKNHVNEASSQIKNRLQFSKPSISRDSLEDVVQTYRTKFTTPEPELMNDNKCSKRLNNSAWKQQTLPAWQPQYRPATIVSTFLALGLVMIAISIPMLITMKNANEIVVDYTKCVWNSPAGKHITCDELIEKESYRPNPVCTCLVNFTLSIDYKLPVYVYYELDGFFQNHRRYVASVDYNQLYGKDVSLSTLESNCAPYAKRKNDSLPYGPCGAIANSLFSDEFQLLNEQNKEISIIQTGITWPADKKLRYHNPKNWSLYAKPINWSKPANKLDEINESNNGYLNEHFIVWMRTAAFPKFRKLWGRIMPKKDFKSLKAGSYKLHVDYSYKTVQKKLNIPKRFVIATSTWLGGRNLFLPILYLVIGSISFITGIGFLILTIKIQDRDRHRKNTVTMVTGNYQTMGHTITRL